MASNYEARFLTLTVTEMETWETLVGETRCQNFPLAKAGTVVIWWEAFGLNNEI